MRPELTEQQRQAVREQPDRPVEVVDSTTNRTYVLLSLELYDQVRPLLGQAPADGATRVASALPSPDGKPFRQRLKDLPTPPEVAEAIYWLGAGAAKTTGEFQLVDGGRFLGP